MDVFDEKVFEETVWKPIREKFLMCGKENFKTTKGFVLDILGSEGIKKGIEDSLNPPGFWGFVLKKLGLKKLIVNKIFSFLNLKVNNLTWEEIIK